MSKTKSFILTDESVNTYGFRILMSGGDLEQFRRNPVMFYNHNDWETPIGRWENIRLEDGKLLADPVFDMDDENAKKIAGKVDRGFLRAASIGLRIIEKSESPELILQGQKYPTVTKWQLREASVVTIGANHNALRLYDVNDKLMSDEQIFKLFDNTAVVTPPQNEATMKKEILTLLDLAEGSTEEQAQEAIQHLIDENKKLQDKEDQREKAEEEARKAEAVKLIDAAIRDGRINADAKQDMIDLFDADFEKAKKILAAIPVRKSVKQQIEASNVPAQFADWTNKSWDELDKAGKLAELRDKHFDIYSEKYEEKFGVKPSK